MFHPVGSQPPSVYWRRRLFALGGVVLVIVLIALTVKIAAGGSDTAAGVTTPSPSSTPPPNPTTTAHSTKPPSSTTAHSSPAKSSPTSTSAAPPVACAAKDLAVAAVVGKSTYKVGDQPLLELQVTNKGTKPCVQDLADKQIELRVYNGESRVWGSHDCQIQPGSDPKTLAMNMPVRVAITWSGLTSQAGCKGTRQRVGAGTYTLYALLSGRTGTAAQFTIT
jgi:hypothetical protein